MNVRAQALYEFGPFRLDAAERLLTRDGEVVSLTPKVYDLLVVLVENRGRMVDKDELMKALWPNTFVEEGNLTQNVSTLRKALGEGSNGYHFIETIPKHGYRFVADLREVTQNGESDVVCAPSLPVVQFPSGRLRLSKRILFGFLALLGLAIATYVNLIPRTPDPPRSIAVLPFKLIGGETGDEYVGFGMADVLITRLSNLKQIQVRPTSAMRRYAGKDQDPVAAGRDLKVDEVLDANIRKVGDSVRVTVQRVRVEDGRLLAGLTFDEKFTDWLSIERLLSERVADGLLLKVSGDEGRLVTTRYTANPEALSLFFLGIDAMRGARKERLDAIRYFEQAVEKDGKFALAYAALSSAHIQQAIDGVKAPNDIWPRAEEAARKALKINENLWEAHISLGRVRMYKDRDWSRAEASFQRAIELNPGSADGHRYRAFLLQTRGQLGEAFDQRNQAMSLDPTNLRLRAEAAVTLRMTGKLDEALELLRIILVKDPGDVYAHSQIGQVYMQKGKWVEAIKELKIASENGNDLAAANLANAYASAGQTGEAERLLKALKDRSANGEYVSSFAFAIVYTGLGDKDRAFQWLNRSFEERSPNMSLKVNPVFESLYSDLRFGQLLRHVGLDQ